MEKRWFAITRWKAIGTLVYSSVFSHDSEEQANAEARERSEKWGDQTPEPAFYGTYLEYDDFIKKGGKP